MRFFSFLLFINFGHRISSEKARVLVADDREEIQKYGAKFPSLVECYGTSVEHASIETCIIGLGELAKVFGHAQILEGVETELAEGIQLPVPTANSTVGLFTWHISVKDLHTKFVEDNLTMILLEEELAKKESNSQTMISKLFNMWTTIEENEREEYRILIRSQRCLKSTLEFVDPFENWHRQVIRGCERDVTCLKAGILDSCIGLQGLRDGHLKTEFYTKPREMLRGMSTGRVCCCRGSRCNGVSVPYSATPIALLLTAIAIIYIAL